MPSSSMSRKVMVDLETFVRTSLATAQTCAQVADSQNRYTATAIHMGRVDALKEVLAEIKKAKANG